jgi:hypothetical protein
MLNLASKYLLSDHRKLLNHVYINRKRNFNFTIFLNFYFKIHLRLF